MSEWSFPDGRKYLAQFLVPVGVASFTLLFVPENTASINQGCQTYEIRFKIVFTGWSFVTNSATRARLIAVLYRQCASCEVMQFGWLEFKRIMQRQWLYPSVNAQRVMQSLSNAPTRGYFWRLDFENKPQLEFTASLQPGSMFLCSMPQGPGFSHFWCLNGETAYLHCGASKSLLLFHYLEESQVNYTVWHFCGILR